MIARRTVLALGLAAAIASSAFAADAPKPFSQAAFESALASQKPFVVQVSAPWCPICRAQKPIVAKLRDQPRFKAFEVFDIDFDTDKASVRAVGARLQSTLIVYNRGREIARTVGDREEGWIEELFEKALGAAS